MIAQRSPADFNAWRDSRDADAPVPVVLDVREPWELQTASVTEDGFTLLLIPMREVPARVEQLREQFGAEVGVRINIDVLNAQSQLFQTKRDLAAARYNVLLDGLRLRKANGTLTPEDLLLINSLLVQ